MAYFVQTAASPQEWYDLAQLSLSQDIMPNTMIMGTFETLSNRLVWPVDAQGALLLQDGCCVGAMLQTKAGRPLISDIPGDGACFIFSEWNRLWGCPNTLFGPARSVNAVIGAIKKKLPSWTESVRPMMAYELLHVVFPAVPVAGRMRFAAASDREWLTRCATGFLVECDLPEARSQTLSDDVRQAVERLLQDEALVLWELPGGGPAAMAAIIRRTSFGASVSWVYTPPEGRQRGYASALVAQLSQHILSAGASRCMLFTDANNPQTNAIYQKIGYRYAGDHVLLLNPLSLQGSPRA